MITILWSLQNIIIIFWSRIQINHIALSSIGLPKKTWPANHISTGLLRCMVILILSGRCRGSKSTSLCPKVGFPQWACWCWTWHHGNLSEGVPNNSAQAPTAELHSSFQTLSFRSWVLRTPEDLFSFPHNKNNSALCYLFKVKVRRPLSYTLPGWLHMSVMYDEDVSGPLGHFHWVSKE